jgi:Fe-S cluster assembly protein SufD
LRWIQVSWGSRLTKAFLDVDLQGKGGHAELLGIYFPTGRQHIDHQTMQIHSAPNCFSDLLFNGALKDGRAASTWADQGFASRRRRPMPISAMAT